MRFLTKVFMTIALTCLCVGPAMADDAILSRAGDMKLKEPDYSSNRPLYACAAIGSKAALNVWFVLDKSEKSKDGYDILWVDLNGNGDLTETGERFSWLDENGERMRKISLPDVVDPDGGATHTNFGVSLSDAEIGEGMMGLRWRDEHKIGGGYPEDPETGYMQFAPTMKEAPVVWFNGDAPFQFQRWIVDSFVIGSEEDVRLFLGWQSKGPKSFCSTQTHVLPEGEQVEATLIYHDTENKQQSVEMMLTERC